MTDDITTRATRLFEDIKHVDENGIEYWDARELSTTLGYARWENFENVVEKARVSVSTSGVPVDNHFRDVTKMVQVGSDTMRAIKEVQLSRYACYIISQNGDPAKPEIALAQAYFTHQTRRQEVRDLDEKERKRLEARQKLTLSDKKLSGVVMTRGVDGGQLAQIKSQGDKQLFGGYDTQAMKNKYNVGKSKPLADHLPTISLTAKQLANEMTVINTESHDLKGFGKIGMEHVHNNIEIRKSLTSRGIKLENLPPEEDIKKVERRINSAEKKKRLEEEQ